MVPERQQQGSVEVGCGSGAVPFGPLLGEIAAQADAER
ncbi:MAG: hypothetical protein ACI9W6_002770 [Motiliproteus sp.]|jgi:hypothetical protein